MTLLERLGHDLGRVAFKHRIRTDMEAAFVYGHRRAPGPIDLLEALREVNRGPAARLSPPQVVPPVGELHYLLWKT